VTAVFLDYNEETGVVDICDLGHSHIFMYRNGKLLNIKTNQNNLPIGISPDLNPKIGSFTPLPDDLVFVITDGLIEQENLSGEIYSLKRIAAIFADTGGEGVELVSDRLYQDFHRFRGKRPLADDVSWLLMRFVEQEITL
jgi:sigma-B regulation protein RsbU (phosphoserine phosphatase)